jgi:hypothetical protein
MKMGLSSLGLKNFVVEPSVIVFLVFSTTFQDVSPTDTKFLTSPRFFIFSPQNPPPKPYPNTIPTLRQILCGLDAVDKPLGRRRS